MGAAVFVALGVFFIAQSKPGQAIPGLPAVLLRWKELDSVEVGLFWGQPILILRLKDGIPVPPVINAVGKWVMDANQSLIGTPLVVSPRAFVQDVSKVRKALEQFAPKS